MLLVGFVQQGAAAIPATERAALINLYNSTHGSAWTNSANWSGPIGSECTWFGVTCDAADSMVEQIVLDSNNLTGSLPSLADFPGLVVFSVNSNGLSGSLPSVDGLSKLLIFSANNNQFSGNIPIFTGLSSLNLYDISNNQLSGNLPSLMNLPNLTGLVVDHNNLSGALPTDLVSGAFASICPNIFDQNASVLWDTATGVSPWWSSGASPCTLAPVLYTVTPSVGANGAVSPNTPVSVLANTQKSFTVTPNPGFVASVGGSCGGALVGNTYTTNSVIADCTVDVTFLAQQSLSFSGVPIQPVLSGGTLSLVATSSIGLAVSYTTATPGVCSVDGTTGVVKTLAAGTCTIVANQAGSATVTPATAQASFKVMSPSVVVNEIPTLSFSWRFGLMLAMCTIVFFSMRKRFG